MHVQRICRNCQSQSRVTRGGWLPLIFFNAILPGRERQILEYTVMTGEMSRVHLSVHFIRSAESKRLNITQQPVYLSRCPFLNHSYMFQHLSVNAENRCWRNALIEHPSRRRALFKWLIQWRTKYWKKWRRSYWAINRTRMLTVRHSARTLCRHVDYLQELYGHR